MQLLSPVSDGEAVGLVEGNFFRVARIACGELQPLALFSDGILQAWGRNYYGQLGDDTTTDRNTPVQVLLP